MKNILLKAAAVAIISFYSIITNAQQFSLPGSPSIGISTSGEPSVSYSAWAIGNDLNQNSFIRISNFKVKGTPYLFGKKFKADVYTHETVGTGVNIVLDTYHQQLEVFNNGSKQSFVKTAAEVDSFIVKSDTGKFFLTDAIFISSRLIDPSKKFFLQQIVTGEKYSLYKYYRSVLGIVSENYVQAELRQFDMQVEYYYVDNKTKKLKQLKLTMKALKNEFKDALNIDEYIDGEALKSNPQLELNKLFMKLND